MKTSLILILLLQVYVSESCNQAGKYIHKGYAYSRQTLPGAAPSVKIDENGNSSDRVREAAQQYFIYTEVTRPVDVEVKYVWINGKRFEATVTEVQLTPVVLANTIALGQNDTLVAKTSNKVWQIVPKYNISTDSKTAPAGSAGSPNAVVIEYMYKGKPFRYTIAAIKKLEPVALQ